MTAKPRVPGKKAGRPSLYSEELAARICERISNGESLISICRDRDMPNRHTVHLWLLDKEKTEFFASYARARAAQADALFDQCLDIADAVENDTTKDGSVNHEHINRARLRVDTRKWMAGKLLPAKYGDRSEVALTGKNGGPIEVETKVIMVPMKEIEQDDG